MSQKMLRLLVSWLSGLSLARYWGIGVLVFGVLLTACNTSAATPKPEQVVENQPDYAGKKVLFINSYHEGYEWSDGIEAGLRNSLNDAAVELKFVRLDTKRNPDEQFGREAGQKAKTEIETFKPEVIIAADDNAQKYLVVPYLKDSATPVIFCGVNWDASAYGYPASNVTGMIEVELPAQLVDHLNQQEGQQREHPFLFQGERPHALQK